MRRILIAAAAFVVIIAALLFFVSSCRSTGPDTPDPKILDQMSANYDTTANISYGGFDATATISQKTPQSCDVAFTAPDSLKDMSFSFTQDAVEVSYKGLSFGFDPTSIPGNAVAKMAVSAINAAINQDGIELGYADGALAVSGTTESGDFTLLLDPENGNLLKLSIPGEQLEIEFENFTFFR